MTTAGSFSNPSIIKCPQENQEVNSVSMNTLVILLLALTASAMAELEVSTTLVPIVSQNQELDPDGSFRYGFVAANGISEQVEGKLKKLEDETEVPVVTGSVSWTAPDGSVKTLTYTADELGYQPVADFLPTSPPIPLPILRAIEYAAAHPEPTTLVPGV